MPIYIYIKVDIKKKEDGVLAKRSYRQHKDDTDSDTAEKAVDGVKTEKKRRSR